MRMEFPQDPSYFLEPGCICCAPTPTTIHTVVGSCVSVCIWDRALRFGGMNHFLYPATEDPEKATPIYGNVATIELVRMMIAGGSRPEDLRAQILGGACARPDSRRPLGLQNVESARRALKRKGIAICSEDTGGNLGRKVVFDTVTGNIITLKVHRIRDDDWKDEDGGPAKESPARIDA